MKSMRASSLGEWKKLSPHESLLAGYSVLNKYLSLPLFHTPNKGIFQAYHWQHCDQSCLKFPQYVLWRWGPLVVPFSNGCSFFSLLSSSFLSSFHVSCSYNQPTLHGEWPFSWNFSHLNSIVLEMLENNHINRKKRSFINHDVTTTTSNIAC